MTELQGRSLQIAIAVSAGSAYLLFGYDQGVLGGLVSYPGFLSAIDNPSAGYLGTIVALFNIGCLMGCVVAAVFGNRLGRKNAITLGCVIMVIGGAVQASTYSASQLIAGRIISGIGNGMSAIFKVGVMRSIDSMLIFKSAIIGINTSTVPVYVSETSRTAVRGRSLAIQMSIVIVRNPEFSCSLLPADKTPKFGTVVAYWLDYGMIRTQIGEVVWRFPLAFQNFFALITIITMPLLPESPRWLYSHGRQREAISVLSRLLAVSEDDPAVTSVVAEMDQALSVEQNNRQEFSLSNLLFADTQIKNTRRLTLCFVIQLFQQFTGINVIAFYVTIVLETNVGLSRELSSLVAGFIQIAFWIGTFPPIFLLDRLGRRKVLMVGSTILCLSMILFTVGIALKTPASSRLALGMLVIYEISFGMSWNSVPWLYAPEITPLNLRHVGAAVGCFSEWLWTFVIAQMTPPAIANTGWKIYILFCIMTALSIPFVYFFMPEVCSPLIDYAIPCYPLRSNFNQASLYRLEARRWKKLIIFSSSIEVIYTSSVILPKAVQLRSHTNQRVNRRKLRRSNLPIGILFDYISLKKIYLIIAGSIFDRKIWSETHLEFDFDTLLFYRGLAPVGCLIGQAPASRQRGLRAPPSLFLSLLLVFYNNTPPSRTILLLLSRFFW
ncbi:unnamed protein product [Penicillium salamii]|uniref:Major facilitator superfamily (MFS) profile domain-containing protein n=1 Tax=Penicillium salamii TaxID=1612424 RepID=A0A9W4NQW4_9EURO|nr:unnamed protein product [Penicillium salamii]CAG8141683.1 unnamed protein product [Penicillium salamii]CAG8154624.1 unnamed protein product [Penicillium salamii]CAG8158610.1 unnamed protein product [Penicillium salamii]CAG8160683.1 unnamed protein product [Penicillium salamii]